MAQADHRAYPNGVRMQRRHFRLIAGIIAQDLDGETRRQAALAFANALRSTNGMFKRQRFLAAYNVEVEQC
jgi:hypothetical protein